MSTSFLHRLALLIVMVLAIVGSTVATAAALDEELPRIHSRSDLSDGQLLFDAVFVDGNLGVATRLVAPDAVIHTDLGDYVGPKGLIEYLHTFYRTHVEATLTRTNVTVVGDFVVIDWTLDHYPGISFGRTLATIEDGLFTSILILDASAVSDVDGSGVASEEASTESVETATSIDPRTRNCLLACPV